MMPSFWHKYCAHHPKGPKSLTKSAHLTWYLPNLVLMGKSGERHLHGSRLQNAHIQHKDFRFARLGCFLWNKKILNQKSKALKLMNNLSMQRKFCAYPLIFKLQTSPISWFRTFSKLFPEKCIPETTYGYNFRSGFLKTSPCCFQHIYNSQSEISKPNDL